MSVSDVLISKPGGLTVAEALSSELPIILYRPIPGQEEANARFLQEKGAALCACSTTEVLAFVRALFFDRDHELFLRLRQNIRKLKRPLAADAIAKSVLSQSFP
jgi:processive 1,2-diacylglycerol beta-glucosyltransferase